MSAREDVDSCIDAGGIWWKPDGRGVDVQVLWNMLQEAQRRYLRWLAAEFASNTAGIGFAVGGYMAHDPVNMSMCGLCIAACIALLVLSYRRLTVLQKVMLEARVLGLKLDLSMNLVRWLPSNWFWQARTPSRLNKIYISRIDEHFTQQAWPGRRVWIDYTNHRGERRERLIHVLRVFHGKTDFYPQPQWLVIADDVERGVTRTFAMAKIASWHWGQTTVKEGLM